MPTKRLNIYDAIWYQFYDLKNAKNDHGEALLLVRLQELAHFNVCFLRFLNCTNGTKLRKASHLVLMSTLLTLNMLVPLNNSG